MKFLITIVILVKLANSTIAVDQVRFKKVFVQHKSWRDLEPQIISNTSTSQCAILCKAQGTKCGGYRFNVTAQECQIDKTPSSNPIRFYSFDEPPQSNAIDLWVKRTSISPGIAHKLYMKTEDDDNAATGPDSMTRLHICRSDGACCTTEDKSALEKDTKYTFNTTDTSYPCANFVVILEKSYVEVEQRGPASALLRYINLSTPGFVFECSTMPEISNERVRINCQTYMYL